jgi:hypothetical protein
LENQDDEDIDEIGYAVSKDTVVRAWKRFRPVNFEENEERNSQIIKNNYTDSEQQNKRKATFKNHVT